MKAKLPRVMFVAPNSGDGKTTVTCAVIKALLGKGHRLSAFKCGPDYIDPMFHSEVVGAPSRNLDLFMLSEKTCRYLLVKNAINKDIAVIEGVMGYYDGISGQNTAASSYDLARLTKTPVVLIVGCKGAYLSVAALIKGFAEFRKDSNIQGVILNNLPEAMYPSYKALVEKETGIPVLGFLPKIEECRIESRHLGLITAAELSGLQDLIRRLAEQAKKTIDLELLLKIAEQSPELEYEEPFIERFGQVRIAVAKDKAFCFYYQDSLELLAEMGAELIYFSPLKDTSLPECAGLILGGGYPELYAKELSGNEKMRESIGKALNRGLPCVAECGGFMYLLDEMETQDSEGDLLSYPMVGALQGRSFMTKKLNRFGYITLTAQKNNLLANEGEQINAHEFHYSDSTSNGTDYIATKASGGKGWSCIHADETLFAGYPHIHFWGNPAFAEKFINGCLKYKAGK